MALLLKTHHAFLQPCEPFARSPIPILRVLGNGPLKAQGDTARQAKSRMAQYSDASPILQLHANGKHHSDVRRRCPLWVKSRDSAMSRRCPLYPQKRTLIERVGVSALGNESIASAIRPILPNGVSKCFSGNQSGIFGRRACSGTRLPPTPISAYVSPHRQDLKQRLLALRNHRRGDDDRAPRHSNPAYAHR